jgi:1-acyl-sn-glycerol-3-phosphate acyltransferase
MAGAFRSPLVTPCLRALARLGLRATGWKVDIALPVPPPFVFVGAPHTSNWDFLLMVAALLELGLDARWLGKDSLFRVPLLRGLLLWLGGIPTDRTKAGNQVAQAAQRLRDDPGLVLCIAPEGTRRKVARWKSGFWHIASQAQVPILLGVIDAPAKTLRLLGVHHPAGDADTGIAQLRLHYRSYPGLNPANASDYDPDRTSL